MMEQVHAHGLGRRFIIADSLERAPIGGVDQQHNQRDAHTRNHKGHERGQIHHHLPLGIADIKAGEGRELMQHVGAVGNRAQLIPLEDSTDDFSKAQGGDGQIVAFQF